MNYTFSRHPKVNTDGISHNEEALLIIRKDNGAYIPLPISVPVKGASKLVRDRIRYLITSALLDNGVTWDEMRITGIECRPLFDLDAMRTGSWYYTIVVGPAEQFNAGFQGYNGGEWRRVPIGKGSRVYYEGFFPRYVYMRGGHADSFIDESKAFEEVE